VNNYIFRAKTLHVRQPQSPIRHSDCVFVPPTTRAWAHAFGTHLGLTLLLGAPLGVILHRLPQQRRLLAGVLIGVGVAVAVPLALSRAVHPGGAPWMVGFLCSTFTFSVFFKSIAAASASFPTGADADLRTWLLWYSALPEPSLLIVKVTALGIVLTLVVNAPAHQPFGAPEVGVSLPGRALRQLLNGASHLLLVYLWASLCLDVGCLLTLAQGVATEPPFRNPLLASRSVREAWGERWNVPVHTLLKRAIYIPARRRGVPVLPAALLTFFCSGLLHEYNFSVHDAGFYAPGHATVFFMLMGGVMLLEELLVRSVSWPPGARRVWAALPSPLISAAIQLCVLPVFSSLFMRSWLDAGVLTALQQLVPHWRC